MVASWLSVAVDCKRVVVFDTRASPAPPRNVTAAVFQGHVAAATVVEERCMVGRLVKHRFCCCWLWVVTTVAAVAAAERRAWCAGTPKAVEDRAVQRTYDRTAVVNFMLLTMGKEVKQVYRNAQALLYFFFVDVSIELCQQWVVWM